MGDVYILDARCALTDIIRSMFEANGYSVKVSDEDTIENNLRAAKGFTAICLFVNQKIEPEHVKILTENGNKLVLHYSAGFDNSPTDDLRAAGIAVFRVPSYSPSSIAEFAVANILALSKKVHLSYVMSKKADFRIKKLQCLLLETRTCGIIGTGLIGRKACEKIAPLVKKLVCYDVFQNEEWINTIPNAEYVDMDTLLKVSNFISVHVPLLPETHHLLNKQAFDKMQQDVVIVNTSRGEILHLPSLVEALRQGKVFGVALDVFEGEKKYIFKDKSADGFKDDTDIQELVKFDNVILSSHIAFYTDQAVEQIGAKTLENYQAFIGLKSKDENAVVC